MTKATLARVANRSIMGVHVRIEADEERLLEAVLTRMAGWPEPAEGSILSALQLGFGTGLEAGEGPVEVVVRGGALRLRGRGVVGGADAGRGEGWCIVPSAMIDDPGQLASEIVDPLLLFLLTRAGRVPVHAAGVVIGDTAVLLAGPSGSGKSTLAHTAMRAGLPILSEDAVYVQMEPEARVWGFPGPIHLLPESAPVAVPASRANTAWRMRNGRWKVAIPESAPAPRSAPRAALCILTRGDAVSLLRLSPDEAVDALMGSLEPGFDHFRAQLPPAARFVSARGAWRLTLSRDPEEALRAVRDLGL
jgi:hypothetical protein